jgi:hypothetical protein
VRESLEEAVAHLSALRHVNPWAALSLLRLCINQRPSYLARVVEREINVCAAFKSFDETVDDDALLAIMGLNASKENNSISTALQIRSSPVDLGGLEMARYGGAAGTAACLQSRGAY